MTQPHHDAPGSPRIACSSCGVREIQLGNEPGRVRIEEGFYCRAAVDEILGQCGMRMGADQDEEADAVLHDRISFRRLVADSGVVSKDDPPLPACCGEPVLIRGGGAEMIVKSLDGESRAAKGGRKGLAEVAVGEEGAAHAARS